VLVRATGRTPCCRALGAVLLVGRLELRRF
jgi:hypothetical protein